jgi:hypothetical protein
VINSGKLRNKFCVKAENDEKTPKLKPVLKPEKIYFCRKNSQHSPLRILTTTTTKKQNVDLYLGG